jgi:hypothetical protein
MFLKQIEIGALPKPFAIVPQPKPTTAKPRLYSPQLTSLKTSQPFGEVRIECSIQMDGTFDTGLAKSLTRILHAPLSECRLIGNLLRKTGLADLATSDCDLHPAGCNKLASIGLIFLCWAMLDRLDHVDFVEQLRPNIAVLPVGPAGPDLSGPTWPNRRPNMLLANSPIKSNWPNWPDWPDTIS